MPRFIGPLIVVEEVEDINYRLSPPQYMKTLTVFYVGRLKRYVDSQEITYSHGFDVSNHVDDHATNDGVVEGTQSADE